MTATLTTMDEVRTQVAIIGAGPAGMLLSHLLAAEGIESVVVESRTEEYVASRIRAGILEQSTVDLLRATGLGVRLDAEGHQHRGIYLQWPGERHHLDFVDLTGRSVWVYGQTEVQKDLVAARTAAGQQVFYEVADTALHDVSSDRPSVTFTSPSESSVRVVAALGLVVPSLKRDRPKLVTALTVAARGVGRALEFRPAEAPDRRGVS